MIYTLDWVKKEAEGIVGAWNGSDEKFSYEGETMTEDDVGAATELLKKLSEVESLIAELGII